jgi:hypothetical protein
MYHGTNDAVRPPGRTRWQGAGQRWRSALTTLILLAGCLVSAVVTTTLTNTPTARADTVPPPPAGWTTVFGDNFAGAAGSAPAASNWFYDIGTGYGTGEKEQTTNSTSNVYLDGNGHLVIKAINNGGTWDIRADREHPGRLPGATGRETRDDRLDPAAEPGQRPRVLAGVLGPRIPDADRRRLAHLRRDRHDGGRQRPERGLPDPPRRRE